MNRIQFYLLILSLIGIYSCKKNTEEILPQYPKTYKSYIISDSAIKVYTKDGEIILSSANSDIIQRFKIHLTDLENIEIEGKIDATYLAEDTVKLTINNIEEEQKRLVYENDSTIYWEKQDTTILSDIPGSLFNYLKYQPLYYEEFDVPATKGYNKISKYKECFYVIRDNESLKVPMFDFVSKRELGTLIIKEINNEFDKSYASLIGDNDTIIIQEYNIELK